MAPRYHTSGQLRPAFRSPSFGTECYQGPLWLASGWHLTVSVESDAGLYS
jgi:hypothetical protein